MSHYWKGIAAAVAGMIVLQVQSFTGVDGGEAVGEFFSNLITAGLIAAGVIVAPKNSE